MMLRKTKIISCILTVIFSGHVVFSTPLPGSPSPETDVLISNETNTLKPSASAVVKYPVMQDRNPMVEDCTLKALKILLSNQDDELSQGCKDILSLLVQKGTGKQRHSEIHEETNLRRELNDLAEQDNKYEALSQQIQNAQNLLAEKRLGEIDDADLSNQESSRQVKSANDELVDFLPDNFGNSPFRQGKNNFQRSHDYKQRYFDDLREITPDSRNEDLWDRDLSDESALDQLPTTKDREDDLDHDYLVIPLRFLRKNMMLQRQPTGTEFFRNNKANLSSPMTSPRKWNGDRNEMVNWLLRALMSLEGRKGAQAGSSGNDITNLNEDSSSKTVDVAANDAKREELRNLEVAPDAYYRDGNEKMGNELLTLDRKILSQVEGDIRKLRKDLLRLQV